MSVQNPTTPVTPTAPVARSRPVSPWPRFVNMALGAWLFISAFVLPHTDASRSNSLIVGLLIAGCAAVAVSKPSFRFANTALSVWLLLSTMAVWSMSEATLWNNVIVAISVFVMSLIPSAPSTRVNLLGDRRRQPVGM